MALQPIPEFAMMWTAKRDDHDLAVTEAYTAFVNAREIGRSRADAGALACRVHGEVLGMDGTLGTGADVWHFLYSLTKVADAQGLRRDAVFGPAAPGGPKIHQMASAVREFCGREGLRFDDLVAEVAGHVDADAPSAPKA